MRSPTLRFQEAFFGRDAFNPTIERQNRQCRHLHSRWREPRRHQGSADRICITEVRLAGNAALGISESNLPAGSEILFREPGLWERYSWQMSLIAFVIPIQGGFDQRIASRTASPPCRR